MKYALAIILAVAVCSCASDFDSRKYRNIGNGSVLIERPPCRGDGSARSRWVLKNGARCEVLSREVLRH